MQALSVAFGQMRDHSRQRTAATKKYFTDQTSTKPAHKQNKFNRQTEPNIHSERGPQRKQANSAIKSFL